MLLLIQVLTRQLMRQAVLELKDRLRSDDLQNCGRNVHDQFVMVERARAKQRLCVKRGVIVLAKPERLPFFERLGSRGLRNSSKQALRENSAQLQHTQGQYMPETYVQAPHCPLTVGQLCGLTEHDGGDGAVLNKTDEPLTVEMNRHELVHSQLDLRQKNAG